jgi:hypothetical protein
VVGVETASYATLKRRLPIYAQPSWRQSLAAACARHAGLGPASLVLFDVSTLYFETDAGDGFRESGFSKERPSDAACLSERAAGVGSLVRRIRMRHLPPPLNEELLCNTFVNVELMTNSPYDRPWVSWSESSHDAVNIHCSDR